MLRPLALLWLLAAAPASPVILPVEVTGAPGTEAAVTVEIPPGRAAAVRSLRLRIHNLAFDGMASVRINQAPWQSLTNQSVTVDEPGRSYGGIGGGFATLNMTLPLSPGTAVEGLNTIRFRFDRTDGVASAFRVLSLNFLSADGQPVLPATAFREEDPRAWAPPLPDPVSIAAGRDLWNSAPLVANGLPGAPAIRAHCSDCHARDARDLRYFNFSNHSIVARSRFHGLSEQQGLRIAAYIRTLDFPNPGRPWNPPYQPGPGVDALPVSQWAAGTGLAWVLDNDADTLNSLFPGKRLSVAPFRPDADLNQREIPISMQLPDWNHWLPRVHPLDQWGERFETSAFARLYASASDLHSPEEARTFFEKWGNARSAFLTPHLPPQSKKWTSDLAQARYSAQLWQLVKTWEITQANGLESARAWPNTIPAATAPSAVDIPDSPAGMGGSGLTNEYFSSAWYELQIVVNSGGHRHHGRTPIDWPYVAGHFLDLDRLSGRPEPGRLLIAIIKAMQSTDPRIGPRNYAEGWRPDQNIDPRIMVSEDWAPIFAHLSEPTRRALTESFLEAWLDKTLSYAPASYFQLNQPPVHYAWPENVRNIVGGKAWQSASEFQKAGVNEQIVQRLRGWGEAWTGMAELFHY